MSKEINNGLQDSNEQGNCTILEAVLMVAPLIQKVLPLDCMIGITDTHKFLAVLNGEKVKLTECMAGREIPPQDAIALAIKQNTVMDAIVPKEAFGFEFRSISIPIKDASGHIVGGLGIGFDLENSRKVYSIGENILNSAQQSVASTEELSASAEELSNLQSTLQKNMSSIGTKLDGITELLKVVNGISTTSKMLGLNASIEAARAGELGKGFSVVASEIRKMAENSTGSIKEINKTVTDIVEEMQQINNGIEHVVQIGEQQASATEEISASTQDLAGMAETMKQAAVKVIG